MDTNTLNQKTVKEIDKLASLLPDDGVLILSQATDFDWDTVFVFPPYSSGTLIAKAVQADIEQDISDTGIENRDDISVFVFKKNSGAIVMAIPRSTMDITDNRAESGIARKVASFRKVAPGNGRAFVMSSIP
jgi:hypothetical protein